MIWTRALWDAFSFLTVIPFPCSVAGSTGLGSSTNCPLTDVVAPAQRMGRAMAWFPAVGALVGASGAATVLLASQVWSVPVAALLGLAVMTALTGGLHLDGFADAVEGLAAGRSPEEAHRIMTDPRLGSFGTAGLVFLLILKWALLTSIAPVFLTAALVTACLISRWAMVLSAQLFPYVPGESGIGRLVTDQRAPWAVAVSTLLVLGGLLFLWDFRTGWLILALTLAVVAGLNRFFMVRLGGVTGDTLGTVNEVAEAVVLLAFALQ